MITYSTLLLATVFLGLFVVFLLLIKNHTQRSARLEYHRQWQEITSLSSTSDAVVRADSLLDRALKSSHMHGATTGERLNNAAGIIRNVDAVWQAHSLARELRQHSADSPSEPQTRAYLREYKKALKDLGAQL